MRSLVMMLARFAVWMAAREATKDQVHQHHRFDGTCPCDACGWVRGLSDEADAAFGTEWRP